MAIEGGLHSDLPVPPGEYLAEVLDQVALSQAELARRMGRPAQVVTEIVKAEKAITPETAIQLEQVVGVPAHIWSGLEAEYRLVEARKREEAQIAKEAKLVDRFPYADLVRLGFVGKTNRRDRRVRELRRFFGVASLYNLKDVHAFQPAFRRARYRRAQPEALAAWLRAGALRAGDIETAPYSAARLRAALPALRRLTRDEPEIFQPRLEKVLGECGVALVLLPHLPKTYAHGATFWIGNEKAVLMLTIRGRWADVFWFSLFHELGHILLHGKRSTFVEDSGADPEQRQQEEEADRFAGDTLIPPRDYRRFLEQGRFEPDEIGRFADRLDIAPGVVTGRLQHDGYLSHSRHPLRERYTWAEGDSA